MGQQGQVCISGTPLLSVLVDQSPYGCAPTLVRTSFGRWLCKFCLRLSMLNCRYHRRHPTPTLAVAPCVLCGHQQPVACESLHCVKASY